ncbi:hypothetical protein L1785_21655 [Antribacter sp. KLBMP9083]|uniref:Uncharacterized protein n=1 Tax=Antribacter soli TaxID=2910976 RepID=A0AA41QK77_9MICO|nr:hypothetical protein [Antribacter soli]MCF4123579.1 hypothetical protein [Antribacter soli]
MSTLKRALAAVATVALTGSLTVAAATPAAAVWYEDGVFALRYTDELWQVDIATDSAYPLTYTDWEALGFPAPKPARTDYVKYPWSPTVYAVTIFGDEREEWHWESITYEQWARAGFPAPRNAGWIEGSYYYQWATSDELFVVAPDETIHKLTFAEWAASGFEQPERYENEGFINFPLEPRHILYSSNLDARSIDYLTYSEWEAFGFPTPRLATDW